MKLDDAGARAIGSALVGNARLQVLHLDDTQIGDEGVAALAAALPGNGMLQTLRINHNQFGDAGAKALAEAIKASGPTLTELRLNHNRIGDDGIYALAEAYKVNRALVAVYLGENAFGSAARQAITKVLNDRGDGPSPPPHKPPRPDISHLFGGAGYKFHEDL